MQCEINNGATKERLIEILSQIIVRTIKDFKTPGCFEKWIASIVNKEEAEEFLQMMLDDLIELELFEYCKDVDLMKGQLELFYSMQSRKNE